MYLLCALDNRSVADSDNSDPSFLLVVVNELADMVRRRFNRAKTFPANTSGEVGSCIYWLIYFGYFAIPMT